MGNRQEGSAEMHAPGGWWGKIDGLDISTILILVIMVLIGFGIWQHQVQEFRTAATRDDDNKRAFMAQHAVTQKMLGEIIMKLDQGQKQAERAAYMQTYVLTLNERERKELKLAMPTEFRNGYPPPR